MKESDEYYSINRRYDGRYEWVCKHGVGHTVYVLHEFEEINEWWRHGCCGCCADNPLYEIMKKEVKKYPKNLITIRLKKSNLKKLLKTGMDEKVQ